MEIEMNLNHSLAVLYVMFAQLTDGELTQEEINMSWGKVREWNPAINDEEYNELIKETQEITHEILRNGKTSEMVNRAIEKINSDLSKAEKKKVISDLVAILFADGKVHKNELQWVQYVGGKLGVELSKLS